MNTNELYARMGISRQVLDFGAAVLEEIVPQFARIDAVAEHNQAKVIQAMQENRLAAMHFNPSTGYGYELTENDVVGTVLTDSAVMYKSRIEELNKMHGAYNAHEASLDHNLHMLGLRTDNMMEMGYAERKRVHNLKYYTWVEQQQMNVEDLNAQWYDTKGTWDAVHAQAKDLDELINEFNEATGLLKAL